jgi:alpha-tubulin suppressor-like RCC1 family protein
MNHAVRRLSVVAPWNQPNVKAPVQSTPQQSLYGYGGRLTDGISIGSDSVKSTLSKIPWASLLEQAWLRDKTLKPDGSAQLNPTHIASGGMHSLIGFNDGTVLGVGINAMGQLGLGSNPSSFGQMIALPSNSKLKQLACGRAHSAVLLEGKNGDEVYTCGLASLGQLGLGISRESYPGKTIIVHTPTRVFSVSLKSIPKDGSNPFNKIDSITSGLDNLVILTTSREVYTTGWGADGQLGLGNGFVGDVNIPTLVELPHNFVCQVSSSSDHTIARTLDGRLWVWGNGEYGQTMLGEKMDKLTCAVPVGTFGKFQGRIKGRGQAKDIAAGGTVSLILTESAEVWSTGCGPCLGLGSSMPETMTPKKLALSNIVKVFAGNSSCAAIDSEGKLYYWGWDAVSNEPIWMPHIVDTPSKVRQVSLGGDSLLCLLEE